MIKNFTKETKTEIAVWCAIVVLFFMTLFNYILPNVALHKFNSPFQIKNTYYTIQPHYSWGNLTVKIKSNSINGKKYLTYSPYVDDNQQFINISFQDKDNFEIFDMVFTKGDLKIASASDTLIANKTIKVSCFDMLKVVDFYATSVMMLLKD